MGNPRGRRRWSLCGVSMSFVQNLASLAGKIIKSEVGFLKSAAAWSVVKLIHYYKHLRQKKDESMQTQVHSTVALKCASK